jgi:hypothetical protein
VTEYTVRADATEPRLLTTSDVVQALADHGIVVAGDDLPAYHPLLKVTGSSFTAGSATIDVYVYPSVADRVTDEQRIQRQLLQLQSLATDGDQSFRITSARNVLLLFHVDAGQSSSAIFAAARSLASSAGW